MKIAGIVVSVLLLIGVAAWALMPAPAPAPREEGVIAFPVSGDAPATPSGSDAGNFALAGTDGSVVDVANFLKDSRVTQDPVNAGYYFLTATSSLPYMVVYMAQTQFFVVDLLAEPLGETRRAAQQYLMGLLGVGEDELCKMSYSVSTSYRVSTTYAGTNLGFPGCPGAITLPE